MFVLAVLYTFWVTYKMVAPLKKLTAAVESHSFGVKSADMVVKSNDEIGVLSRALNESYNKIYEYSSYISSLAYRDSLTGLLNRTAYAAEIDSLNKEISSGDSSFGLLVADLNYLKQTNDRYGHDIGNEILIHSSRILKETFKTSIVYRIGGDEFVVVLKGEDLELYHSLIENMDAAFSADYICVNDGIIPVSIARGVAVFDPDVDRGYSDVFERADHAMYKNKAEIKAQRAAVLL